MFPIEYFQASPAFAAVKGTKTRFELSCHPLPGLLDFPAKDQERPGSALSRDLNKLIESGPDSSLEDKEKWLLLARELAQKQEIIHRMMREVDDKSASLKLTTAEILDLRRTIKMMQSENAVLRRRMMGEEEGLELQHLVSKEISHMSNEELKAKVVKLASAYRSERLRNEEFERALKSANVDLVQAKQTQAELENMQQAYAEAMRRLAEYGKEAQKTSLYKDTIKKQERVITKLETLLEKTLKDTQRARDGVLELEKLRTENLELQQALKSNNGGPQQYGMSKDVDSDEVHRLRGEVQLLEGLVSELRAELKNKRPQTPTGGPLGDWEDQRIDMEVKAQKAQARIDALQAELTNSAQMYAREISKLKLIIAEKDSLIETMSADISGARK